MVMQWHSLPKEVMGSLSLKCGDGVGEPWRCGTGGHG